MSSDPIKPRTFRGLISMAMLVLSCLSHADGARSPSPLSPRQDQFIPLRFHKMHANGDDFVVVDSRNSANLAPFSGALTGSW
ncbi:hypothetical protein EB795_27325 [Pseudomonas mandelii]|nr:hypothetical protein [Pseudomonas mandelii]